MAEPGERLYETNQDLTNALVDAIRNRDKMEVAMIGMYALTTEHEYPLLPRLAEVGDADHTDYIWGVANRRLGQLNDPASQAYLDRKFPPQAA